MTIIPILEEQPALASERDVGEPRTIGLAGFAANSAFYLGRQQAWNDLKSSVPLIILDVISVVCAVAVANSIERWQGFGDSTFDLWFTLGTLAMILLAQSLHGLYPGCGLNYSIEFRILLRTSLIVCVGLAVGLSLRERAEGISWLAFAAFTLLLCLFLSIARPLARRVLMRFDWWVQPLIIVGSSARATALFDRIRKNRSEGIRPVGMVFDTEKHWSEPSEAVEQSGCAERFIGPLSDLESILVKMGVCRVFVADIDHAYWHDYQSFYGIPRVTLLTELGHHPTETTRIAECDGRIEFHCHSNLACPCSVTSKRVIDLVLVVLAMPLWLPLAVLIAILIRVTDPGPIFFRQTRIGRFGIPFQAIKFRSMVCNADQRLKDYMASNPALQEEWAATHKLKKDPRVTRIGEFLRKSSLDELPQLWNVFRGDMSLVGPRPIIDGSEYDREYIEDHPEVFELYRMVRPGVTGMWQISGRNSLPYKERVSLDRFYLRNWSLGLDCYILWRTVKTALLREGAF
jgi:Undecaprenyl-phosphate galactose phosphotransferase WbaP